MLDALKPSRLCGKSGQRWLLGVAALMGCFAAEPAFANCNVTNSNISLGSKTGFQLDSSGTSAFGSAGISCTSTLNVLGSSMIGLKVDQPDNLLHRVGGGGSIPFVLSWTENGPQIANGVPILDRSTILIGLLFTQNGQTNLYARTATAPGTPAGTYRATVTLRWYWSICLLAGVACSNSTTDLRRASILGIEIGDVINIGTGVPRTLTVELVVTPDCSLTVPTVNFGQAALPSQFPVRTHTINARCTAGHAYTVGIDNGQNPESSVRRMKSGSNYLAYDLWKGEAGTERWGTGSGNWRLSSEADDNPALDGIQSQGFRFRAQVRPDQAVPKGVYQDMLTVRIDY